jgi:hypothetical protein
MYTDSNFVDLSSYVFLNPIWPEAKQETTKWIDCQNIVGCLSIKLDDTPRVAADTYGNKRYKIKIFPIHKKHGLQRYGANHFYP